MVRAILVWNGWPSGGEWRVREVSYNYYIEWLKGHQKDRQLQSYWFVWVGGNRIMPDANEVAVLNIMAPVSWKDIWLDEWKFKLSKLVKLGEMIKRDGERLGVRDVIITSSTRSKKDGRRQFAKYLLNSMLKGNKIDIDLPEGKFGDYEIIDFGAYKVIFKNNEVVAYDVEGYLVSDDKQILNKIMAEML